MSSIAVAFLTLVLVVATVRYVRLTQQIAEAAAVQAEASYKPVLTLRREEKDNRPTDIAVLTERIGDVLKNGQATYIGPTLEIVNIGSGPAMHVKWRVDRFAAIAGSVSYICPDQWVSLELASKVNMGAIPTSYVVECQYESISGRKYFSRTGIERSTKIVSFEVSDT